MDSPESVSVRVLEADILRNMYMATAMLQALVYRLSDIDLLCTCIDANRHKGRCAALLM